MYKRAFAFLLVIVAGETIFMLPFMIPRLVRPLLLEGWGLTNRDFGVAFSIYGILAAASYLFGGPFADKWHPRILISGSLALTALVSLYLVSWPSAMSLNIAYGLFGVTTVLLIWGALIKTTHLAGGEEHRSLAMGILDGGRGLAAAAFATLLIFAIGALVPDLKTHEHHLRALKIIYLSTAAFTSVIAVGIWFALKDFHAHGHGEKPWTFGQALESLRSRKVWLLSVVVLGAYCGYKSIDNYATYLVDVHGLDLASASHFTAGVLWLRPLSAIVAGGIADRWHKKNGSGRFLFLLSLLLLGGGSQILMLGAGPHHFYSAVMLASAAFAFALRAIYFSVLGDLKIPNHLVGTTTGLVSLVGFMPDIFFGWITGYFIDVYPGARGFELSFAFTAACLFIGAAAGLALTLSHKPNGKPRWS